jgi:hypothetical protein
MHTKMHTTLENRAICAYNGKGKCLRRMVFHLSDHPHTVEVTGSIPVTPITVPVSRTENSTVSPLLSPLQTRSRFAAKRERARGQRSAHFCANASPRFTVPRYESRPSLEMILARNRWHDCCLDLHRYRTRFRNASRTPRVLAIQRLERRTSPRNQPLTAHKGVE